MLPHIERGGCVQVFSAMVMSFAHGSNDVANAMGEHTATVHFYTCNLVLLCAHELLTPQSSSMCMADANRMVSARCAAAD